MEGAHTRHRRLAGLLPPLAVLMALGCQSVRIPEAKIARSNVPRELTKTSLPAYTVEPPDLIRVEVLEALPGRPISGERLVRPDGTISLDFYGDIYVAGLTTAEVKEKVIIHMRNFLSDASLGLVEEDENGQVQAVPPARSDRVFVDVSSYNSKAYYVQGDVAQPGRLPITGNETVLDAINFAGGLLPTAATQDIRLVRPAPPGACCQQVLPVNFAAIVNAGDTTTNYQLLPGDRVVIYRDPVERAGDLLTRLSRPFQTVLNALQSYSFAARSIKTINAPIFTPAVTPRQ
ncbi:MAG TPA: polysaccharide biosynthesis/export family protein [Isosphaeraceae bacterium]|jgi:polysaccharide export outer membrane protein